MTKLYSEEEVWSTYKSKPSERGLYFYCQFQTIINLNIVKHIDILQDLASSLERHRTLCSNIFNGLLDFVIKDREIRKKYSLISFRLILMSSFIATDSKLLEVFSRIGNNYKLGLIKKMTLES